MYITIHTYTHLYTCMYTGRAEARLKSTDHRRYVGHWQHHVWRVRVGHQGVLGVWVGGGSCMHVCVCVSVCWRVCLCLWQCHFPCLYLYTNICMRACTHKQARERALTHTQHIHAQVNASVVECAAVIEMKELGGREVLNVVCVCF